MKKIHIIFSLALFCIIILTSCSKNTNDINFNKICDEIYDKYGYNDENMEEISYEEYDIFFDFSNVSYEKMIFCLSTNPINVNQFILVKASSDADLDCIKTIFETRIKNRKADFEGYAPIEYKKLENALLLDKSRYIFLFVGENTSDAKEIFQNYF